MRGVFDEEETERLEHGQDREITLGSGALLGLLGGLLLLCGICFGLGYAVGHQGPQTTTASSPRPATEQEPLQASGSIPKPSAIAQTPIAPPQDATAADGTTIASAPAAAPGTETSVQPGAPQVHPAFAPGGTQPYAAAAAPAAQQFVVQVAAVSNPNDAEVLIAALRKRDFPVIARREPADHFIHVRVGPFANRALAEQWRMKLLNDGYNAEIQP